MCQFNPSFMNQTIIRNIFTLVFPKIGVGPPNHPFVHRVFHEINHPFGGYFPSLLLPCYLPSIYQGFKLVPSPKTAGSEPPCLKCSLKTMEMFILMSSPGFRNAVLQRKNKPEMLKDSNRTCKTCWFVF